MFYQIFLSPQVKQCAIITYKHELPKDLRLRAFKKVSKFERVIAQGPFPPPK